MASAKAIRDRWQPDAGAGLGHGRAVAHPAAGWSRGSPGRSPAASDLPYVEAFTVARRRRAADRDAEQRPAAPQRARQARRSTAPAVRPGPVLLVDDLVDSGWTLTVAGWLLREQGSGEVHPFALAAASARDG